MKRKYILILLLNFFVILFSSSERAQVISKAKVQSVQLRTNDGIIINVSTPKDVYKFGEEIVIDYSIQNTNAKAIYLVTDSDIELWSKDEVLWLEAPIKYASEYRKYNYELVKIPPKKFYKGKVILDSKKTPYHADYAEDDWKLQIGFAYLFNINDVKKNNNDMEKLFIVGERSVTVYLGSLFISVKNE